jgi:hypothetical protein
VKNWVWKEIAEVLGVIGVIASLVLVAFEIRQNTRLTRSTIVQDISRWSYDASVLGVENPELRAAFLASCEGVVNDDQCLPLRQCHAALMRLEANRYYQAQLGLIDEAIAEEV